jgi:hypothetical protein
MKAEAIIAGWKALAKAWHEWRKRDGLAEKYLRWRYRRKLKRMRDDGQSGRVDDWPGTDSGDSTGGWL